MESFLKKKCWSPYIVGALIGVLSWALFYFLSEHIGTTMSFVRVTAYLENLVNPSHVAHSGYFQKYLKGQPIIGWQEIFVVFIFFGSLLATALCGSKEKEKVPELWQANFGKSRLKRNLGAFIGGFFVLFGARIASGCTSGHAISGGLQLALSGWVFIAALFAFGILTAFSLYKIRRTS